ncbi:MAG: SDR family oxidoreductase [Alphaproteobacteria bacterium]|nr:SDR family oxidoreductase [Alphaproteobacteria bacterium]
MIVVTGATGKVGRQVVTALKARGAAFRVTSRDPKKAAEILGADVSVVTADYAKPETLGPALRGADHLFLLCGPNEFKADLEIRLADAAKAAGVQHIVKLSVYGADERSSATVMRDHRRVETHIEGLGLDWTHLRPNLFMQHFLNHAASIKAEGVFHAPLAEARVSVIDTRDIGAVAAVALTEPGHAGRAYELTGPAAPSYGEIAKMFTRALGRPIRYEPISAEEGHRRLRAAGSAEWHATVLSEIYTFFRAGEGARVDSAVERVTGRTARSMESFIADHRAAFSA